MAEGYAKLIPLFRQRLQAEQADLRAEFERTAGTVRLLKRHCRAIDRLLGDLWQAAGVSPGLSLIAVGGYGRGELFPHSDVDLLILLPNQHDPALDAELEALVGLLWDIGLAVGHSVRNLDECLAEAANDVTVQTNLLEIRWLAGNRANAERLREALAQRMDAARFFQHKMQEQRQRHRRFNETAYNLEPNVKESPGGLRDLHNILWISRSIGLGGDWGALVQRGLITPAEAAQIRRVERFTQMLRIRLHYLAGRREDRLLFDFQHALASQLGFASSARKRASEQLMQRYYRGAKFISLMNDILLESLGEQLHPPSTEAVAIAPGFCARDQLLEIAHPELFREQPEALLKSFLLLAQHPELQGFSATTLRALWRSQPLIDQHFRANRQNQRNFIELLCQSQGITRALRSMSRYGILGRYIPAFGRIVGQMQHDLFHVYTVDEHILNVLGNLRRFTLEQHAHEFPLCSQLINEFPHPELLYLAALFHDIAKGRGGDHSALGTVDARRFCKKHGLSAAHTDLVAWLVEQHLIMSSTAQKADLSDPAVIEAFAGKMETEERLVALYLLTVADIRGTSPAIWNAWKARLLEHLFLSARRYLRGIAQDAASELAARQQEARQRLSLYAILPESYRALWGKFGEHYFLRHESHEIAWHTRMLLRHADSQAPIVRARLSPDGGGIQVMIYMRDQDVLFARICDFFDRLGYNIVEAKIYTTQHGYALDSFLVLSEHDLALHYRDLLSFIEYELAEKLAGKPELEQPMRGRISRQLKHFPIRPEIHYTRKGNHIHAMDVVAGDSPGLLSRIAQTMLRQGVRLHGAKINTLGDRAEDTFLISAQDDALLSDATLQAMHDELAELLK